MTASRISGPRDAFPSRGPVSRLATLGIAMFLVGTASLFALSAPVHPLLAVALAVGAAAACLMLRHEFLTLCAYVFIMSLVPIYVRLPVLSMIHPFTLVLFPALGWAVLQRLLHGELLVRSRIEVLALLYPAAIFVTALGPGLSASLRMIFYHAVLPLMVFLLTLYVIRDNRQIEWVQDVLLLGAVLTAGYAIWEYASGHNPLIEWLKTNEMEGAFDLVSNLSYSRKEDMVNVGLYRVYGTFINPIELGTFLGSVLPYPILGAIHGGSRWRRWAYAASAAVLGTALVLTYSRGCWLAAAGCLLILAVVEPDYRRFIVAALVAIAVAVLVLGLMNMGNMHQRLSDSATVSTRLGLWRLALLIFCDHPLTGIGYGNLREFIVEYADRYGALWMHELPASFPLVESTYLQLLSETGILGFSLHMMILGTALLTCYRLVRRRAAWSWRATAMGFGIAAYAINGLGSGAVIIFCIATQAFWLLIALACRLDLQNPAPRPGAPEGVASTPVACMST